MFHLQPAVRRQVVLHRSITVALGSELIMQLGVFQIDYGPLPTTNHVSARRFSDRKSPGDIDFESSIAGAHDPDVLKSLLTNFVRENRKIFAVMESRVANLESDNTTLKKDNTTLKKDNTTLKKDNISQAAVIASLQSHNQQQDSLTASLQSHNQQQDSLIFSIFDSTHSPILLAILFKHGYKMLVQAPHTSPTPIRAAYVPQSINTQADLARERNLVQMEILARRKQFGSAKHLAHEISDKILKLSHHFKVVGQPWEGPMVWYAAQYMNTIPYRNSAAHSTNGDSVVLMYQYLKDVKTKDWVQGVFPAIFGRPIDDWDNATASEKAITIWNSSDDELAKLPFTPNEGYE